MVQLRIHHSSIVFKNGIKRDDLVNPTVGRKQSQDSKVFQRNAYIDEAYHKNDDEDNKISYYLGQNNDPLSGEKLVHISSLPEDTSSDNNGVSPFNNPAYKFVKTKNSKFSGTKKSKFSPEFMRITHNNLGYNSRRFKGI